jgi:CheY-like chemotaxis protein
MDREKQTILLVDNKQSYRETVRDGLELAGYSVIEAENREEALVKIRDSKPALALVDVRLVHEEKPEDFTGLKLLEDLHEIPVIIVTAYEKTQLEAFLKMNLIPPDTPRPKYILEKGDARNLNNIIAHVQLALKQDEGKNLKLTRWLRRITVGLAISAILFAIYKFIDKDFVMGVTSSVFATLLGLAFRRYGG